MYYNAARGRPIGMPFSVRKKIVEADRNRLSTPITTYGVSKVVLREKSEYHDGKKIVE